MEFTTVVTFIKDVIATLLTLLMMMSPAFGSDAEIYSAKNPDELVMSFSAVSDIHVETNNPKAYNAFKELIEGVEAYENNDAVLFLGDNVMNGQIVENLFFYTGVKAVLHDEKNIVVMGNHDIGNGEGDYDKFLKNYIANNNIFLGAGITKPYHYEVINGCYMVVLASEALTVNNCVMSEEQLSWLEGVLNEAAEKNAPIFVFNHHPLYQLEGVPSDSLAKLLSTYDNLLYIHGHIHDELGADNFKVQGGVNTINLPRSTEVVDYEPGGGIVVEVYETEVVVRGRNFVDGEWIDGLEYSYPLV